MRCPILWNWTPKPITEKRESSHEFSRFFFLFAKIPAKRQRESQESKLWQSPG